MKFQLCVCFFFNCKWKKKQFQLFNLFIFCILQKLYTICIFLLLDLTAWKIKNNCTRRYKVKYIYSIYVNRGCSVYVCGLCFLPVHFEYFFFFWFPENRGRKSYYFSWKLCVFMCCLYFYCVFFTHIYVRLDIFFFMFKNVGMI